MPQLLWPCDLPSFKMELKQLQVQKPHKTGRYQEGRSPAQLWNQNACCSVCIGHAKQGCLQTNALAMQGDRRNSASCSHHYVLLPPGRHILHRWTHGKERCYFSQTSCKSRSEIDFIGGLKKAQVLKHRGKTFTLSTPDETYSLETSAYCGFVLNPVMCIFDIGIAKLREGEAGKKKQTRKIKVRVQSGSTFASSH